MMDLYEKSFNCIDVGFVFIVGYLLGYFGFIGLLSIITIYVMFNYRSILEINIKRFLIKITNQQNNFNYNESYSDRIKSIFIKNNNTDDFPQQLRSRKRFI